MFEDFRFAVRRLRHSPGFTLVALLTLTLAIGVNVSVLSIADAVLFRPLPYEDPDRVFVLQMYDRQTSQRYTRIAGEHLQAIDDHHSSVGPLGILGTGPRVVVDSPLGAERVATIAASANYFNLLGVRPARGRVFTDADASATGRPALLTHHSWLTRFSGDPAVVGNALSIGGQAFDIVGVLPQGFVFPSNFAGRPEIVTVLDRASARGATANPIVRLEPGVTLEQAQAEMDGLIVPRTRRPGATAELSVSLDPVRTVIYPVARSIMLLLVGAAILVLLIGAANLANMLLARTVRAERENGLRAALGAERLRVVRPILFECLILGGVGAMLAVLAAWVAFDSLLPHIPRIAYRSAPIGLDARIAMMAISMGLAAGVCFAIVPAWRSARVDPQVLLQARHRPADAQRRWFRHPLISLQVAASIVLIFGAVVAARAFVSRLNVPLGFDPTSVVTVSAWPADKGPGLLDFYVSAIESLARRSDVISVGAAGSMPLDGSAPDESIRIADGSPGPAGLVHVLPGYFETVSIRLIRGRLLDWKDVHGNTGAALMSQSAAAAVFRGADPLGKIFTNTRGRSFTVVGIVADVLKSHDTAPNRREPPTAYIIPGTDDVRRLNLVVRMRSDVRGDAVLADLRRQVAPMALGTTVGAEWWAASISALSDYRNPRFQAIVLGGFGILAMTLMAIGVFGVIAFLVVSRTREIGIRVAIGAEPRALVLHMVRQAAIPAALGVIVGLAATRWMARLAEAQLFEVKTNDPWTLTGAAVTVMAATLLAAYIPARRAAEVDPVVALRSE